MTCPNCSKNYTAPDYEGRCPHCGKKPPAAKPEHKRPPERRKDGSIPHHYGESGAGIY